MKTTDRDDSPETCILAVGLDALGCQAAAARHPARRASRARCRAGRVARLPLRPMRRAYRAPCRSWRLVQVDEAAVLAERRACELRPSAPRPACRPAPAAHLVLLIVVLAVTSASAEGILAGVIPAAIAGAAVAVTGVAALVAWIAGWVDREFVRQWRMLAWLGLPVAAAWGWIAWVSRGY